MKTRIENRNIETSGIDQTKTFSMKASAKSFKILSSGVYENKIRAIIRELSTNAYDSHVQANKKNVPFKVHLPTLLEPFFEVLDYGVGLSHEDVLTLYTTYFESTKTESDDFVGNMGIGSKVPFCYQDSFDIISNHEGMKRYYNAYVNELGIPQIAFLGETSTDETNGVSIKVNVKSDDIKSFEREAIVVYKYFDVRPNTNLQLDYNDKKPIIESKDGSWALYDRNRNYRYNHNDSSVAIMGNIAYPLPSASSFTINLTFDETRAYNSIVYDKKVVINFNIGDLDFATSRETLSLDEITQRNILNKVLEISKEIKHTYLNDLNKIDNTWGKIKKYASDQDFVYSFFPVNDFIEEINIKDLPIFNTNICSIDPDGTVFFNGDMITDFSTFIDSMMKFKECKMFIIRHPKKNEKQSRNRILKILDDNNLNRHEVKVITVNDYDFMIDGVVDLKEFDKKITTYMKKLGNPPYVKLWETEVPKKDKTIFQKQDVIYYCDRGYQQKMTEDRFNKGGTYFVFKNSLVNIGESKLKLHDFRDISHAFNHILVNSKSLKLFEDSPDWINGENDLIEKRCSELLDTNNINELIRKRSTISGSSFRLINKILSYDNLNKNSLLRSLSHYGIDNMNIRNILQLSDYDILKENIKIKKALDALENKIKKFLILEKELYERYPLLFSNYSWNERVLTDIVDYVNMKDNQSRRGKK